MANPEAVKINTAQKHSFRYTKQKLPSEYAQKLKNYCNTLNRTIKAAKKKQTPQRRGGRKQKYNSSDLRKIINEIANFRSKRKKSQQSYKP